MFFFTEMGALLSRKQDVNVKDLITTQSMLPGYSGERTFENTVSYSDQLARPPLNQVSRAGVSRSTEEHWSQMKACEGAKTKVCLYLQPVYLIISRPARRREIIICTMFVRPCVSVSHSFF